jgi:membrane protein DedA with SNARE-associated domain
MAEGLTGIGLDLVVQYGYLALFVFMFLETSMLFPLLPSEITVPFAAAVLVVGPASFGLFVLAATAGATVGSVVAYYLFAATGDRALARYRDRLRVSDERIERSRRWFRRWGEGSVFWGRLLPVARSIISIPAGFARMDLRRFTAYSAGGSGCFAAGVAALVYRLDISHGPVGFLAARLRGRLAHLSEYATAHPLIAGVSGLCVVLMTLFGIGVVRRRTGPDGT